MDGFPGGSRADTDGARPILVTGAHRSGSTWVGRMLAASPRVHYIDEPFHMRHHPGVFGAATPRWFTYVTAENEAPYLEPMQRTLALRFDHRRELESVLRERRNPRTGMRLARGFRTARLAGCRPLLKDPVAVFSTPWLVERFDVRPVVVVRHPAAFAGSIVNRGWDHPFRHFLEQPLLMRDHLAPYADDIERAAAEPPSLLRQAALLWRLVYSVVDRYRADHPDWIYVRHHDLAADPLRAFEPLYDRLGLPYGDAERAVIASHVASPQRERTPAAADDLVRTAAETTRGWRRHLDEEQSEFLREDLADLWPRFYDSWEDA